MKKSNVETRIFRYLTEIISETNGISLNDTLELLMNSDLNKTDLEAFQNVENYQNLIAAFLTNQVPIHRLLKHPVSWALQEFFKKFPLKYREEHIHLTGSITADFIYPRLKALLEGPHKGIYEKKIKEVYGESAWPIRSANDVDQLIRLKEGEGFGTYLKIIYLPKLIFVSKEAHMEAAYHMAEELYKKSNVGSIRLKFSLSRSTSSSSEQIPGLEDLGSEDVVMGLYEGFHRFRQQHPDFNFILSPSFRKESNHFDSSKYKNRQEHFQAQVNELVELLEKYPELEPHLTDVDTVGDEREMYKKTHFFELQNGFRKLQYKGFEIRSHHGETWHSLKKGIQAVDNAMNIWHIDTLEHGISLGINPNFYFHRLFQEVLKKNAKGQAITSKDNEYGELVELDWGANREICEKLLQGVPLHESEKVFFVKAKFHTAREVEHYQHDVLNRMIQKGVSLIALPSSNNKLTGKFEDYKDHPFSWWEKKGVRLGVGTDNYVTLNTSFIQEMLILLLTDPENLKITKLLMVVTGEMRRPYISDLLWKMRKEFHNDSINEN